MIRVQVSDTIPNTGIQYEYKDMQNFRKPRLQIREGRDDLLKIYFIAYILKIMIYSKNSLIMYILLNYYQI